VLSRFVSGLINGPQPASTLAGALYKQYTTFCSEGNFKFVVTSNAFGRDIKKIEGIVKRKVHGNNYYNFDIGLIKKYLEDHNEYDPDAELA
jgi:hypothetical protein